MQAPFRIRPSLAALVTTGATVLTGCYQEPDPVTQIAPDTDGDGIFTSGFDPGTADETGEPDPHEFDGCIYDDLTEGAVGFKFACEANIDLDVVVTVDSAYIGVYTLSHSTSENTLDLDNLSETLSPLVGACCADNPLPSNTCGTAHHQACVSDAISHQCALVANYVAFLSQQAAQPAHGAKLKKFASDLAVNDCYGENWGLGGSDTTCASGDICGANYCSDGIDTSPFEFSYSESGFAYDNNNNDTLFITVDATGSTWFPSDAVQALPGTPEECTTPAFNDGALPLVTEPATGSTTRNPATDIDLDIIGPSYGGETISGDGAFRAGSFVETTEPGTDVRIEQWSLRSETPAQVGTSSVESTAHAFFIGLLNPRIATKSGSLYTISAGDALFTAGAEIDEIGGHVVAYNKTDIDFYWISGGVGLCPASNTKCLVNRAFSIEYVDAFNDRWIVDVAAGTWEE